MSIAARAARGLFVVCVGIGLLTACTSSAPPPASVESSPSDLTLGWTEVDPGHAASLPDGRPINGPTSAPANADGLVLVNFWASTCGPCADEMPMLDALHDQPGVRVVGVSTDMFRKYAREFLRDLQVEFPSWMDSERRYLQQFAGLIPVRALPTSVLIKNQRVVAVHVGPFKNEDDLIAHVTAYA